MVFLCYFLEREACEKCPSFKSSSGNRFTSVGCRETGTEFLVITMARSAETLRILSTVEREINGFLNK